MSIKEEWPQLAVSLGLKYIGSNGLTEEMSHGVAGLYRGFPALFRMQIIGGKAAVAYVVRVAPGLKVESLKAALPRAWRAELKVTEDTVSLRQPYWPRPPASAKVAETFRKLTDAVAASAEAPTDQCESCKKTSGVFHVANGLPMSLCDECVSALRRENETALLAYEQLEAHPVRATLWGIAAAIAGGVGWGLLGSLTGAIWVPAAILIGFLVAWAVLQGNGKVTRYGQALVLILTLGSLLFGDVAMVALMAAKEAHTTISLELFSRVLRMYSTMAAERTEDLVFSAISAAVGALFGWLQLTGRRPKPLKIA